MTDKSFKFAMKSHNLSQKAAHHYDIAGSRTDRSLAALQKDIVGKASIRLSSSPVPLKQRKKTIQTSASQHHNHHQSTSVGPAPGTQPTKGLSSSGTPSTTNFNYNQTAHQFNPQSHPHQMPVASQVHNRSGVASNSLLAAAEAQMTNQKVEGIGESMTARELKLTKQIKTYKAENKHLMQLLKDSQRILNEKLAESKKESEKIAALFNKLWPALQGQIKGISPQQLLQSLEGVIEGSAGGGGESSPKPGMVNSDAESNAIISNLLSKGTGASNSANSTALTTSEFQSTLIEALEQQKQEFDKEKYYLLQEVAHLRAERDSLVAFIKKTENNEKSKSLQAVETALHLVTRGGKTNNKENKRPSSGRRAQVAKVASQTNEDNIPAFLKATSGLKGDSHSLEGSFLNITKVPSTRAAPQGFLEALGQAQEMSGDVLKQEDQKGGAGMRKSRTLGLPSAQSSMAQLNAQQQHHHHLPQHNNYHLSQHHHHIHAASPIIARPEAEMSPIQQRMMHYYQPLNKSGPMARSPKP